MHELYELKDMLMKELKEYGGGGDLSAGSLEIIDKLTHTIKNLCKIIDEAEESEGYSNRYYPMPWTDERRNGSYARGRRRDAMGRYSRDGLADKLRDLMADAPDEHTRSEIQRLVDKMEK